jgi:hypothetical protein
MQLRTMLCYILYLQHDFYNTVEESINYTYTPTNEKFWISAWFLDTDSVDK